jgi:hypothetical protein
MFAFFASFCQSLISAPLAGGVFQEPLGGPFPLVSDQPLGASIDIVERFWVRSAKPQLKIAAIALLQL